MHYQAFIIPFLALVATTSALPVMENVGQDDAITKARHEESSIWFKSYTDDAISKDPPATTDADAKARREEASIWLEAYTEDASGKASSMESDSGIWLESYTNDAVAE